MLRLIDVGSIVYSRMVVDDGDVFVPLKDISDAPTVDAVPVRCKDCKHCYIALDQDDSHGAFCRLNHKNNHRFDWYCGDGVRR